MAKGVFIPSKETRFVYEYHSMRILKKLGFNFSADKLFDIDVSIYSVIDDELAKVEREEIRKPRKK